MQSEVKATKNIHNYSASSLGILKNTPLFSKLSDKEIGCFYDASQHKSYEKGKILYLEEEPAKFFYVICSGWIKLFHTLSEGNEIIVDMIRAGHVLGAGNIFERGLHTSNAQVVEDVQLISIPLSLLSKQIRLNSTLALNMLTYISRLYRRHCTEIALNSTRSAPQRIGNFLLRLCPDGKKTGVVLHLPYDKTLIAHTLGMTRGSFSRALNILRLKTSIRVIGTRVEIDSTEQLASFVYGSLAIKPASEKSKPR